MIKIFNSIITGIKNLFADVHPIAKAAITITQFIKAAIDNPLIQEAVDLLVPGNLLSESHVKLIDSILSTVLKDLGYAFAPETMATQTLPEKIAYTAELIKASDLTPDAKSFKLLGIATLLTKEMSNSNPDNGGIISTHQANTITKNAYDLLQEEMSTVVPK